MNFDATIDEPFESVSQTKNDIRLARYEESKLAKVGALCVCAGCGVGFVKRSYQQKFHSVKCKDKFWNLQPHRIERTKIFNLTKR